MLLNSRYPLRSELYDFDCCFCCFYMGGIHACYIPGLYDTCLLLLGLRLDKKTWESMRTREGRDLHTGIQLHFLLVESQEQPHS